MLDRSTLRVALRTLGRHRGFAAVAILSLAAAIALNTVMYSVTVAMLDPKINVRQPEHIYSFFYYGNVRRSLGPDDVEQALRAGAKELESVSGYTWYRSNQRPVIENGERYKRIGQPMVVRPNFFQFLGTAPLEGRTFRESDEAEGDATAVISHRLAAYLFPNESPLGQPIMLDGAGFTVIGVVEYLPGFALLANDMWVLRPPAAAPVRLNLLRFTRKLEPFALNKQLELAAARLAHAARESAAWTAFVGKPVHVGSYNKLGGLQYALIGAVLAVLLVACANLANLQLARGLARSRELALRSAVGASRRQLINLLMLESGVLAVAGLALGIVLTLWGVKIVSASIPEVIAEFFIAPQVSWTMFVFAAVAAVVCLLLVGLVPALRISRVDPNDMLKSGAGTGANKEHRRRYGIMVVAQIGFALPVLIGCVLLLRGSYKLHSRDYLTRYRYGYDPKPLVVSRVPISVDSQRTAPLFADVAAELTSRARAIPGVVEAAVFANEWTRRSTVTAAMPNGDQKEVMAPGWSYRVVSPSYFRTMGRSIVRGRGFNETEVDGRTVIIDSRTAKFLFGDENPIGRSIKFAERDSNVAWHEVIGIVGDARSWKTIEARDPYAGFQMAEVFRAISVSDKLSLGLGGGNVSLYARVQGNTELAALRMLRNLRSVRGAQRPNAEPLELNMGIYARRQATDFVAALFTTFGMLGIALVAIGVYGIVAHSVEERRREIAVRISLGATARNILHSVLREGNVLILAGVAIGLLLAKSSVWWLSGFIDELDGYHALLFAYIAGGLFALAAFAAFIPALRATRIDPVEALRHE